MNTHQVLQDHLKECSKRWLGQRSQAASITACENFIRTCIELGIEHPSNIGQYQVDVYAEGLKHRALSASTINTRLCAVKGFMDYLADVFGPAGRSDIKYPFKTRKKSSKWHMTDAQLNLALSNREAICADHTEATLVMDYIHWTIETGLRVEETLRLAVEDFEFIDTDRPALIVPGTKNEHSRVRIPISRAAADIINRRRMHIKPHNARRLFDISYRRLHTIWDRLREVMGVQNDPTSTLKALRRNFAATALRKGLDPRIIQELMRHSNLETTMGYLRLIGLSDNDETRALLNRQIGPKASDVLTKITAADTFKVTIGESWAKGPSPMPPSNSLDLFDDKALLDALNKRGYVVAQP